MSSRRETVVVSILGVLAAVSIGGTAFALLSEDDASSDRSTEVVHDSTSDDSDSSDLEEPTPPESESSGPTLESDPLLTRKCNSAFDIASQGNGSGSPYADYSDEDIEEISQFFRAKCNGVEDLTNGGAFGD